MAQVLVRWLSEKFWSFVQETIDLLEEKRSRHLLLLGVEEIRLPATTDVMGARPSEGEGGDTISA
jgi:hypothetical protein